MDKTFETYLQYIHAEDYVGAGDDMGEAFNEWLQNLDIDDWLTYGNLYGIKRAIKSIDKAE